MKKTINWFRVSLLIVTIAEVLIILFGDKSLIQTDLNNWRMYIMLYMFAFINVIIIVADKKRFTNM